MTSYISDSEDEGLIPISSISLNKFTTHLNNLNNETKTLVINSIQASKYNAILELTTTLGPSGDNDTHNEASEINSNKETADIMALVSNLPTSNSRRGLRKRNFASTHPYLADQAHWLDLASVDYLNDIYEESQDLPGMMKMLNQKYLRRKMKYPNEDKYKSKNFYSFLGRANPNKMMYMEDQGHSSQYEDKPDQEQEQDSNNIANNMSDSNYESDDSISFHQHHVIGMVHDSDDENQGSRSEASSSYQDNTDDDELDDTIVRVGGRIRKEKSVLIGVLPESAKRLNIYKGKRSLSRKKRLPLEKRKGLAIKKMKSQRSFINEADLYNDIVDNESPESDGYIPFAEPNINEVIDTAIVESSVFDSKYNDYIDTETESDNDTRNIGEYQSNLDEVLFEDYPSSVYDEREINPDIVRTSSSKHQYKRRNYGPRKRLKSKVFTSLSGSYSHRASKGGSERGKGFREPLRQRHAGTREPYRQNHSEREPYNQRHIEREPPKQRHNRESNREREPFGSRELKQRHLDRDPSIGSSKEKSIEQHKDKSKEKSKDKAREDLYQYQPDLSNYYFKRNPIIDTTVFEVESNKKIVNFNKHSVANRIKPFNEVPLFYGIDLPKLSSLNESYIQFNTPNSLMIELQNTKYTFDLVNKHDSIGHSSNLLLKIAKLINENSIPNSVIMNIIECCKVLINWYLSIQENPGDNEWKYLRICLNSLIQRESMILEQVLPFLLILFFIFWKLNERYVPEHRHIHRDDMNTIEDEFINYCGYYWKQLFLTISKEEDITVECEEKYEFLWKLLKYDPSLIWKSIDVSLDQPQQLEGIFFIANRLDTKYYNWNSFYKLYDLCKDVVDSKFQRDFLDVCLLLNQRKSWPIEEKLVLKIYSNITKHKFFNLQDENLSLNCISKVYTFNDIPDTSVFECFLQFLYYYVSGLETINSAKRLATKLLISSYFQYEKGRKYQVAFLNRFNFIILLSQISNIDQTNVVNQLIKSIIESNDIEIYSLTIKQLKTYNEIMLGKETVKLPLESFGLLIDKFSQLYLTVPGISKILIQLNICIKSSFCLESQGYTPLCFKFLSILIPLNLRGFCDDVSSKIISISLLTCNKLKQGSNEWNETNTTSNKTILQSFVSKMTSFLSYQMGRFPTQSRVEDMRLTFIIEQCISIWIMLTKIIDSNWNKILLQDYPYMGNSYSREKFVLFLLARLLEYDRLQHHETMIIETALKQLVKVNTSNYTLEFINILKRHNHFLVNLTRPISEVDLITNKTQLMLNMISNINNSNLSNETKKSIILTFIESLNDEYDRCFMSVKFVEACKKVAIFLQSQYPQITVGQEPYTELANKLNITPISVNQLRWKNLPEIEQLSFLHKEIISSLIYNKDPIHLLDQYCVEGYIPIYHLITIYLKEIIQGHGEFWVVLSICLQYLNMKFRDLKIDICDREFGKFILMLVDSTSVFNSRSVSRFSDGLTNYQLQAISLICDILKLAYVVYDGYKDKEIIIQIMKDQIMDYDLPTYKKITELSSPYSNYILYDISNNSKDLSSLVDRLTVPELERYSLVEKYTELKNLVEPVSMNIGILEVDF